MTKQRTWTGDPQRRWAETSSVVATSDLPDPAPFPPYRSYDDFHLNIEVPDSRWVDRAETLEIVGGVGFVIAVVTPLWGRDRLGPYWPLIAAVSAVVWVVGLVLLRLVKARREQLVIRTWTEAMSNGTPVHWYGTKLVSHYRGTENGPTMTVALSLLVDARLPVGRVAHIRRAVHAWTATLPANKEGDRRLPRKLKARMAHGPSGRRLFVPLTDVFGAEAAGAWFWHDEKRGPVYSPHALLIQSPDRRGAPRVLRSKAPRDEGADDVRIWAKESSRPKATPQATKGAQQA
jgi:hypothetical protein